MNTCYMKAHARCVPRGKAGHPSGHSVLEAERLQVCSEALALVGTKQPDPAQGAKVPTRQSLYLNLLSRAGCTGLIDFILVTVLGGPATVTQLRDSRHRTGPRL